MKGEKVKPAIHCCPLVKNYLKGIITYLGKNWTKSPETKKMRRGTLVGVEKEEEKIRSYKFKVLHRFQI